MLQHNASSAASGAGAPAHWVHAAVASLHALCCGLPAAAMLAVAVSGAASGVVALAAFTRSVHGALHLHEGWIVAVSAALFGLGAALEAFARRDGAPRPFPWLFALSASCLVFNVAVLAAHRLA